MQLTIMDGHAQWSNELFDCCRHVDTVSGRENWFPLFFPSAFNCPCGLLARTESVLENEDAIDCCCFRLCLPGVGPEGLIWCTCAALANLCLPLPISPIFACFTVYQRWRIMDQFNIDGDCMEIMKGCCYPCALYQHYIFVEDMRRKRVGNDMSSSVSENSGTLDSGLLPPFRKSLSSKLR